MNAQPRLTIVPLTLAQANEGVERLHRHHKKVVGHQFSIGVRDDSGELRGVAILSRPVARKSDDGFTLEVTRVATDGCPNAPSALYGAARRVAKAMGFRRLLTFTLASEPGTSLRAAGWKSTGTTPGRSWSVPSREREDSHPLGEKVRWEADL